MTIPVWLLVVQLVAVAAAVDAIAVLWWRGLDGLSRVYRSLGMAWAANALVWAFLRWGI